MAFKHEDYKEYYGKIVQKRDSEEIKRVSEIQK